MKRWQLIAGWIIFSALTTSGVYHAVTAETSVKLGESVGTAILGGVGLAAAAWHTFPRKVTAKAKLSEIGDVVVFARFPYPGITISAVLALLALALFLIGTPTTYSRYSAIAPIAPWMLAGLAVLFLILPWRITLRLSPEGLQHSPWPATIPWSNIRKVTRKSSGQQTALVLDLREPEKYQSQSRLKRLLRGSHRATQDFVILPFLIGGDADHIAREISRRIDAFGAPRAAKTINAPTNTATEVS